MKFLRLDLLTLLISLFIFNSCKRQDGIGLGIDPTNQINGALVVDSNIIIRTEFDSTAVTSGLAKTPLGNFTDPAFGTTVSNVALGISLPNDAAYTVPAGTLTIDSAVLVLRYANGFYGDSVATRYTANVYQLAEKAGVQTYYNTKRWQVNTGTVWGTKTFTARTHDSVTIANIRTGKVDTIQKVGPQVRIPFSKAFIYNNLFNANGSQLASTLLFQNAVKGLYITLDKGQANNVGGILQLALDSSRLDVFYKTVNGTTIDTATVSLPFVSHSAAITYTYTTTIQALLADKVNSQNTVYLQGLAGLRAKVSFPDLNKFNPDSIVLNRAELVITPQPNSGIPYAPLPKLTMYQLDIAHQRTYIQDASPSDGRNQISAFGGRYDKTKKEYHFLVTAYVQDLIRKKTVDYGTFIAPIDTTEVTTVSGSSVGTTSISPSVQVAARTVAVGSDKSSPYKIKLNIIYTRIRK
ncbi:protein of unknown function [Mucilaginibacter lappiensis]|uniref:DUF4270 domain-containing protein n=1 Tax=Mucilaginibacter lappiensis TaxID=354630 RepID=A0ABR6PSK7_9SPHI|nr:DUF4270 family protein [Mucilaginibacter lappiensis]MBB6112772.1 hypothetical protein [Mucilaginibacter lappiensis]SIS07223.1 protein of unknown function [Mucilaginibacter lappiensis]